MRTPGLRLPLRAASLLAAMWVAGGAGSLSAAEAVTAETLFSEGRGLMAEGRAADACPKFAASLQLDPALGTLLNLGDCYERTGKTASALAMFREAARVARASGDGRRAAEAEKRAAGLDRRVSKLTILAPASVPAGLVVRRGASLIEGGALGIPTPVDPGHHLIEAEAPGHVAWRTMIEVREDAAQVTVQIANLEPADTQRGDGQRSAALIVGGIGVAGVLAGSLLSLRATSKWQDVDSRCGDTPCASGTKQDMVDEATTDSKIATVTVGVGVVGLAAGCVLWWTAPARRESSTSTSLSVVPAVSSGAAGLSVQGGF